MITRARRLAAFIFGGTRFRVLHAAIAVVVIHLICRLILLSLFRSSYYYCNYDCYSTVIMGIKGLAKLISDEAPDVRNIEGEDYEEPYSNVKQTSTFVPCLIIIRMHFLAFFFF